MQSAYKHLPEYTQVANPVVRKPPVLDREKVDALLAEAARLREGNVDWVLFAREIIGNHGMINTLFASHERALLQASEVYATLQRYLMELRESVWEATQFSSEPKRVIAVRLPSALHEALKDEAWRGRKSLNQLCIAKLLQRLPSQQISGRIDSANGSGEQSEAAVATSSNNSMITMRVPPELYAVLSAEASTRGSRQLNALCVEKLSHMPSHDTIQPSPDQVVPVVGVDHNVT